MLKNDAIICWSLGLLSRKLCITTGSGCVVFPVIIIHVLVSHVVLLHVVLIQVVLIQVVSVNMPVVVLPLVSVPVVISCTPLVMVVPTVNKLNSDDQKLQSN